MQAFDCIRELKNGKRYDTTSNRVMSKTSVSEASPAMNPPETKEIEGPEVSAITQDEVDEKIKSFIAPLTRQLEDLTPLVRGMTTASHPNNYPSTGTSASSLVVVHPDISPTSLKSFL